MDRSITLTERTRNMIRLLSLSLVALLGLNACAPLVVGGAAATGATVAHDRRTAGTILEDKNIYLKAAELRDQNPAIAEHSNIAITSYNLQVLLTGQAESAAISRQLADEIARLPRVRKVFNEVKIGAEGTWGEATADAYTTSRVKLALFDTGLKDFDPTRVKVVTSLGTVYLMGLLTPEEADAVTEKVRYVSGVKHVVRLFEYIPAN